VNSKAYFQFNNRFKKIDIIDKEEIKKASVKDKLKKLISIIALASELGLFSKKRKDQMINNNWSLLKA